MTEDYLYLNMNELETKKKVPKYFSSLAFVQVLYDIKQISFNEYLYYFAYLSSYRFKFLRINSNDIEKAVLGEGRLKVVNPKNIRKFNFPLTLAEEYEVTFQIAFRVVLGFFIKILWDSTITTDILGKIFIEILNSFPTKLTKREFGRIMLRVCKKFIENRKSGIVLPYDTVNKINEKINYLLQITDTFNTTKYLWIPK